MNPGLSEKDLLKECIKGDKKAWDLFVEKYTKLVYNTILKTLQMYHSDFLYQDLEDIHNNIFLSLIEDDYKKLRQYKGINGCTVSSWIMVITTNTTLNFIKRNKTSISLDDPLGEERSLRDTISDPQPSVIKQMEESEQSEILREIMDGLGSDDKLFLKYYYEEELSPEEIAGIMNLSAGAIYSKKSRIIEKLKKIAKKKNLLQEI
jgi:RNA polymerase sigma-70 factor (ECF subfamily)